MFKKQIILWSLLLGLSMNLQAQSVEKIFVFGEPSIFYPHIVSVLKTGQTGDQAIYRITDFNKEFQSLSLNEKFNLSPIDDIGSDTLWNYYSISFKSQGADDRLEKTDSLRRDIKFKLDEDRAKAFLQVREHDLLVIINFQENDQFYQFTIFTQEIRVASSDAQGLPKDGQLDIIGENAEEHIFYIDKRGQHILEELEFNIRKIFPALNEAPKLKLYIDDLEYKVEGDSFKMLRNLYDSISIDATPSIDLDNDRLQFEWSAQRLGEEEQTLLLPQAKEPRLSLKLDRLGEVLYTLHVTDGIKSDSIGIIIKTVFSSNHFEPLLSYNLSEEVYLLNENKPQEGLFTFDIISPQGNSIDDVRIKYNLIEQREVRNEPRWDTLKTQTMRQDDSTKLFHAQLFKPIYQKDSKGAYRRQSLMRYWALDRNNNLIVDTSDIHVNEKRIGFLKIMTSTHYLRVTKDRQHFKYTNYLYQSIGLSFNLFRTQRLATAIEVAVPFFSLGWNLDNNGTYPIKGGFASGIKLALLNRQHKSLLPVRSADGRVMGIGKQTVSTYPLVLYAGFKTLTTIGQQFDIGSEELEDIEQNLNFLELGIGSEFRVKPSYTLYLRGGVLFANQSKFVFKRGFNLTVGFNITTY